mmetsp:Transcript_21463/g.37400  ORF Transcript_21463/g.37400 Transcript_21463/m.37400 type:complete len:260 (-) Transcript_21463:1111-1890(-)
METLAIVRRIKLTTKGRLHEEVQGLRPIVALIEFDDKGGIRHHQDVLLVHDTVLHVALDNVTLAQSLHCIGIAIDYMLVELDSAKATTTKQSNPFQLLSENLLPRLVVCHHCLHTCIDHALAFASVFVLSLDDVLQWAQQHIEGLAVKDESLCGIGGHHHGCLAHFAVQQRLLTEDLRGLPISTCLEHVHFVAVFEDLHFAFVQDVECVAGLSLLQDDFAAVEVHLDEGLRDLFLLLSDERGKDLAVFKVLLVLGELVI